MPTSPQKTYIEKVSVIMETNRQTGEVRTISVLSADDPRLADYVKLTDVSLRTGFDYKKLRRFTYPILGVVTAMMILSVIGFGHRRLGPCRLLVVP